MTIYIYKENSQFTQTRVSQVFLGPKVAKIKKFQKICYSRQISVKGQRLLISRGPKFVSNFIFLVSFFSFSFFIVRNGRP